MQVLRPTTQRPVLLLEINEVPWKVIDRFREDHSLTNLRAFFESSRTYTTRSTDAGELSPWVTWPSLHRGVNNVEHRIKNLGQDPETFRGKPIWQEFRERGASVGICGSLQSWPPIDPGPQGFYIPDTFAHDSRCVPSFVEPFQRFNLSQVRNNGRVVRGGGVLSLETLQLLGSLPKLGIRLKTVASILRQLVREKKDRRELANRPVFQAVLLWDVFQRLYDVTRPPAFATFFTNHVAGLMHRYWRDVFPEDFPDLSPLPADHVNSLLFALRVLDSILADAMRLSNAVPGIVLAFATSMGQEAVRYPKHEGREASITDLNMLMISLQLGRTAYKPLPAMVPQAALECEHAQVRKVLQETLLTCTTSSGDPLFEVDTIGRSLSITVRTPRLDDIRAGGFKVGSGADAAFAPWRKAGITFHEVEAATAYHIPEGVLAIWGRGIEISDQRTEIALTEVRPLLLRLAGFEG